MTRDAPIAEPAACAAETEAPETLIRRRLGRRSIVLVGLMGAGKSTVGRRLAGRLGLPFRDADHEIEQAAGLTIPEIFERHGEPYFREGERKVIQRLLQHGPGVLATGGGAYMSAETREAVTAGGIAIWLRAELEILMRRVRKRQNRPLLKTADPEATMRQLIAHRHPIYALAEITIESREAPHDRVVGEAIEALAAWLAREAAETDRPAFGEAPAETSATAGQRA